MIRQGLKLAAAFAFVASSPLMHAQVDWAKTALEKSPRHHEWVSLKNGSRTVPTFVVYPEVKERAPVIVMMGEITGLTDWAKETADELAEQGYIVVAPDLLSGAGPNGGGSDSFSSQDAVIKAASGLSGDQVNGDLDAAADYGKKLPASNGKLFVVGFCWGGAKSFAFAAHRRDLTAAFVFYGEAPADISTVTAPVYGFYGEKDARIGATLPGTIDAMKAAGKKFVPVTYDGAGHGYMRAGSGPDATPVNKTARDDSFKRLVALLKQLSSGTSARLGTRPTVHANSAHKVTVAATMSCHEDMSAASAGEMSMAMN